MRFAWLVYIMISIQSVVGRTVVGSATKAPGGRVVRDDETDAEGLSAAIDALMTESQGRWDKRATSQMRESGGPVRDHVPLKVAVDVQVGDGAGSAQKIAATTMNAARAAQNIKEQLFRGVEDRFLTAFDQRRVELTQAVYESSIVQGCKRTSALLTPTQDETRIMTKKGDGCQTTLYLDTTREVKLMRTLVSSKLETDIMNFVRVASKPKSKIHMLVYTFSIVVKTSDVFNEGVAFQIDTVEITVRLK
jgi:hypothetical protein